jgi:alpha-tubulin suppressor-like RCC1 family protein
MASHIQFRTPSGAPIHALGSSRTPALLRAVITAVVFAEAAFARTTSAQIRRPPTPPVSDSARAADSAMRDLLGLAAGALRCADAGGCPAPSETPLVFPFDGGGAKVRAVAAPEFIDLAAAGDRTCALAKSGELYCWRARDPAPARVETTIRFAGIAVGPRQVCAAGLAKVALPRLEMYCAKEDGRLVALAGAPIFEQFALGDRIFCGRTPDGPIWCRTGEGRLAPVPGVPPLVAISTGADHACGQSGGVGYCWGRNDVGQLGDGSTADREAARAVPGALRFRHIDAVGKHSCGVAVGGALYCWGERQRTGGKPVLVDSNPSYYVVGNSCVYTRKGVASCWGPGLDGNGWEGGAGAGPLGIGLPKLLTGISEPIALSVRGNAHRCALTTARALYCWGTWRRDGFDPTPTRVTQVHVAEARR